MCVCFLTFVFMVCCDDVRRCQGVRQHSGYKKNDRELFWVEGTKSGTDCARILHQ